MLVDIRGYETPELDAVHETVDVRVDCLRVSVFRSRNVTSDYRLLERATPFVHRLTRPQLVVLLEGSGRMEEGDRRSFLSPGDLIVSNARYRGTEAYSGAPCTWLTLSWDPLVLGPEALGAYTVTPIGARDRQRLHEAALRLRGGEPAVVMAELVALLRSVGVAFAPVSASDLRAQAAHADDARLQAAVASSLANLATHPSIDDIAERLRWSDRSVHRRFAAMADAYQLPWTHWREALHQTRITHAMRLLSAPAATTELVARLAGFRAPSALCHAFTKANLPSPQTLARAARCDVLDRWFDLPL